MKVEILLCFSLPLLGTPLCHTGVFSHLIRNLAHNAEVHGGKSSTISMTVAVAHVTRDKAKLCVTIINSPGVGHANAFQLQQHYGPNFLFQDHLNGTLIGSKDSTFLGMREISQAAVLLNAEVSVLFEESQVVTLVACPVDVVEIEVPLAEEVAVAISIDASNETLLGVPHQVMYILCDDDKAPRAMGRGLLRNPRLPSTPDSCVLGEHYSEVKLVAEMVLGATGEKGAMGVACIFDQNMHWPQGTVLGSDLVEELRAAGFKGLTVMRTANDSETSCEQFLAMGADAVLSKGMSATLLIPALLDLRTQVLQSPNRHAALIRTAAPATPGP